MLVHPVAPVGPAPTRVRRPGRISPLAAAPEEAEVAVFRFTLGVKGLDDAQLPRLLGAAGAVLLVANHLAGGEGAGGSLGRTEGLGAVLVAACATLPSLGERLEQARGGVGSAPTPAAQQAFILSDDAPEALRQDVAWASYALLTTTNASTVLLLRHSACLAARGALPPSSAVPPVRLGELAAALAPLGALAEVVYTADLGAGSGALPEGPWAGLLGCRSLLVAPAGTGGVLVVAGRSPRALDAKARALATALAAKLGA